MVITKTAGSIAVVLLAMLVVAVILTQYTSRYDTGIGVLFLLFLLAATATAVAFIWGL